MNKKVISLLLIFSITLSMSIPVSAGTVTIDKKNHMSYTLEDQNKSIFYIGENKLVLWEVGDTVFVDQYDLQGNLIVSGKGNRKNGEIVMVSNDAISSFNAKDIVQTISVNPLPSLYSFERVGTFPVYDRITSDRQTMYLYEDTGSAIHTTYAIRSYTGSIAALVIGIATGMFVPSVVASGVVSSMISTGLAFLVGETLNIASKITLAADKYELEYYGQDSKTGRKSDIYDKTDKYIISDEESNKMNEVYYDGSSYYDPDDDDPTLRLTQYIVPNLYGSEYEWDRW